MATKKTETTKTTVKKTTSATKKPAAAAEKTTAAAKKTGTSTSTAKKPATTAAKKPATTESAAAKKPAASSAAKTSSQAGTKLTAAEKRLLEAYREADQKKRDAALALLEDTRGEENNVLASVLTALAGVQQAQDGAPAANGGNPILSTLLSAAGNSAGNNGGLLGSLLSGAGEAQDSGSNPAGGIASLLMGLLK